MRGLESFNVVLLGTNFPVQQIELDEFTPGGQPLVANFRLPVILEASNADFKLSLTAERFSLEVAATSVSSEANEELQAGVRLFLSDYIGKKAVVALGHNFTGKLGAEVLPEAGSLEKLVQEEKIAGMLGSTVQPSVDMTFRFRKGSETHAQLRLSPNPVFSPEALVYDFNFHFQLNDPEQKLSPEQAVAELPTSAKHAQSVVSNVIAVLGSEVPRNGQ